MNNTYIRILVAFLLSAIFSFEGIGQTMDALLKKANNGSVSAQIELAECYLYGNGVDESESEAIKWYELAAGKGNIDAMVACGDLYCNEWNLDLEPDYVKGIKWYRKAAAKGNTKAKKFIENFKITQENINRDCPFDWLPCDDDFKNYFFFKDNIDIINKGYVNKNPIALYYMAIISYIEKDYSKTVNYLREIYPLVANEDNYFEDIFEQQDNDIPIGNTIGAKVFALLGWCYEHGLGVETNYVKAAEYYLSEFDYTAYGLSMIPKVRGAYCYKKAGLVNKFIKEVYSQGIDLGLGGAIDKYYVPCLKLELAEMYKTGDGVTKDLNKALSIYESIVDQRKGTLGIIMGVYPEVRSYSDIGRAAYRAAQMYRKGIGCKADEYLADLYIEIALKYGDKNAWYEYQSK